MSTIDIEPFKISIPEPELELLHKKLLLTRLPKSLSKATWTESSPNGVTITLLESILQTWLTVYSWRDVERQLNSLPQYMTSIPVDNFGQLNIQFVHSLSTATSVPAKKPIPLLFLHGWPGSILEISKALPLLNKAGFDVVAPSHPGYLSSTLPSNPGFKLKQHAECSHKLMLKLGYEKYVIQGGDWGGEIAPTIATLYPEHVLGMHVNYFPIDPEPSVSAEEAEGYSAVEKNSLKRYRNWKKDGIAYGMIQQSKPLTLGIGLHDSPIGLLTWITDKILDWADSYPRNPSGYRWSNEELITWTLIHYFSDNGPTGPFQMYSENRYGDSGKERGFVTVPTGVSALWWESEMVPRKWAERKANVVWWREHKEGGHFAVYEKPTVMVRDVVDFVEQLGIRETA